MPRNVEIKARVADPDALESRIAPLATGGPQTIVHDDTFFAASQGRLKLRCFTDGRGELIAYARPDVSGPKTSDYLIAPVADADALRDALARALGATGRVFKRRTLYLIGRTRVHLDRVEGLGDFLELEVILGAAEEESAGVAEAHALLARLGIEPAQLVSTAYVDLLGAAPR